VATNPASADDLIARSLRPLSALEVAWGETRLEDAFDEVVSKIASVETRLDAIPVDNRFQRVVIRVLCDMVLRVLGNPDGKLEEQGDDYRYRLDAAVSSGALYVSDAELELLGNAEGVSENAFTIRMTNAGPGYRYPPNHFRRGWFE
jgi:hypothetical protein